MNDTTAYRQTTARTLQKLAFTLGLCAALGACGGQSPLEHTIFNAGDPDALPKASSPGQTPSVCYGMYKYNPGCHKATYKFDDLRDNPSLSLNPYTLSRLSWYMEYSGRNTVAHWDVQTLHYTLTLLSEPVDPSQTNPACRAANMTLYDVHQPQDVVTVKGPFCYNYTSGQWLPQGLDPAYARTR